MKLFIWHGMDVLGSSGMVVAIAGDLEQANRAVRRQMLSAANRYPEDEPSEVIDLGKFKGAHRAWVCRGRDKS